MFGIRSSPSFEVRHDDPTDVMICGFAEFGLAGLTAVDYLTKQLELEETGHISVEQLPPITPFENGTPRHHTRLFSKPEFEYTILVGELYVPPFATESFGDAVLEYTEKNPVEEVVVLSGVPFVHESIDHRPFFVASDDYQREHDLSDHIEPMAGGFLDGINGALMQRAVDSPLRTAVFTTPVHPRIPDVDAALRLINAVTNVYDLEVDIEPLESFAAEVSRHYEELAARVEEGRTEMAHDDRMYM